MKKKIQMLIIGLISISMLGGCGNQSDIMSNVEISMDMNGTEYIYNPSMSLENGHLEDAQGVCDFSIYYEYDEYDEYEWDE